MTTDSVFDEPDALMPLRAGMTQIVVAHAYGVPIDDIRAASRGGKKAAKARQVAMYLSHIVFAMSCREIAHVFGRHRSTANHAIHRVEALRDDPEHNRTLGWLETTLRGVAEGRP